MKCVFESQILQSCCENDEKLNGDDSENEEVDNCLDLFEASHYENLKSVNVAQVSCGESFAALVTSTVYLQASVFSRIISNFFLCVDCGIVMTWGNNAFGRLGQGNCVNLPQVVFNYANYSVKFPKPVLNNIIVK